LTNAFDERVGIIAHLAIHLDDRDMLRPFKPEPRSGVRLRHDNVRPDSFHHPQRFFNRYQPV
jgi:hypothetical protein